MNQIYTPLLSVIVPVYGAEAYLDECLRSLTAQTYTNLEIILVDDGSPDGSGALCDAWAVQDARIRVLHQANAGPSAARNAGLAIARGEWLGFVDSDDWIAPNMYQTLMDAALRLDADMACGRIVLADSREDAANPLPGELVAPSLWDKKDLWTRFFRIGTQECIYYTYNRVYDRSLLDALRFPEDTRDGEDVEVTFHALLATGRIARADGAVYYYYQNTQGLTLGRFHPRQLQLRLVWDRIVARCRAEAPELLDWARINRARTDFTLLTRIILADDPAVDVQCAREMEEMRRDLAGNRALLLSAPLPIGRRVAILALSLNYPLTCRVMRAIQRLRG